MKLTLILITLLTFLISSNAYAQDLVLYLEKSTPAPYSGYLLPAEKAIPLSRALLERDSYKLLNDSYEHSLSMQKNILDYEGDRIAVLKSEASLSDFHKILWFAIGAGTTILISYGIKASQK